jgi:hypothetical protein
MTKRNGKSFTIRDAVIRFGEARAAVERFCMYGVWEKKYPYLVLVL